jgi:hypothetical protein
LRVIESVALALFATKRPKQTTSLIINKKEPVHMAVGVLQGRKEARTLFSPAIHIKASKDETAIIPW